MKYTQGIVSVHSEPGCQIKTCRFQAFISEGVARRSIR